MPTKLITLTGGSPWGFTLSGGKDFGSHLRVSKVTPGGKAARGGVKQDDYLLAINGDETEGLLHFDAQQMIKATGMSLQLKLASEAPRSPAIQRKAPQEADQAAATSPSPGRPRPPPPPMPSPTATTPSTTTTTSPKPTTYTSTSFKTTSAPPKKPYTAHTAHTAHTASLEPMLPTEPSQLVPDSGLGSGSSSQQQSPAFKRITIDDNPTPSVLSPPAAPSPPTQQMRNIVIDDGNVKKTSYRPQPPPNVPSKVTTSTVKVAKESPIAKPAPPPTVHKAAPPTSPGKEKMIDRQGVCSSCNEPIRGPFASAMGRVWHPEHFTCNTCHKQLNNTTFVFEEEQIFCESCYEKTFAKTCYACHKPILGPCINALNLHWHQEHFRCSQCNGDLSKGEGFNMEGSQLFCSDCFGAMYGATCYGCGQKIGGDELWIEALQQQWHSRCFVCESCKTPLEGGTFFSKLGRPFCRNCA